MNQEIPSQFHPENNLTNELESVEGMIRDAKKRIYYLEERMGRVQSGALLPEGRSVEELNQELDETKRTLETLLDEKAKILGTMAHEEDVLGDIEKQFKDEV